MAQQQLPPMPPMPPMPPRLMRGAHNFADAIEKGFANPVEFKDRLGEAEVLLKAELEGKSYADQEKIIAGYKAQFGHINDVEKLLNQMPLAMQLDGGGLKLNAYQQFVHMHAGSGMKLPEVAKAWNNFKQKVGLAPKKVKKTKKSRGKKTKSRK